MLLQFASLCGLRLGINLGFDREVLASRARVRVLSASRPFVEAVGAFVRPSIFFLAGPLMIDCGMSSKRSV